MRYLGLLVGLAMWLAECASDMRRIRGVMPKTRTGYRTPSDIGDY